MSPHNQSILVSGESGAGKTESVKLLMSHLAEAAANKDSAHIVSKVLESNPLLESFGNAKTGKNDNSSRFGKYVKLHCDEHNQLKGSFCNVYLLEKSRVVSQSNPDERNFHIFYQLLAAPSASKMRWQLMGKTAADFRYTQNAVHSSVADQDKFASTMRALDLLNVPKFEQENMCRLLSGILFLGQISFGNVNDESVVDKRCPNFQAACNMLGFDSDSLSDKLTCRSIEVAKLKEIRQRRQSLEETVVHLTPQQVP